MIRLKIETLPFLWGTLRKYNCEQENKKCWENPECRSYLLDLRAMKFITIYVYVYECNHRWRCGIPVTSRSALFFLSSFCIYINPSQLLGLHSTAMGRRTQYSGLVLALCCTTAFCSVLVQPATKDERYVLFAGDFLVFCLLAVQISHSLLVTCVFSRWLFVCLTVKNINPAFILSLNN